MQAFPFQHKDPTTGLTNIAEGMTLRDYFAAKAMQGLLASDVFDTMETFATRAYLVADALLEARKQ